MWSDRWHVERGHNSASHGDRGVDSGSLLSGKTSPTRWHTPCCSRQSTAGAGSSRSGNPAKGNASAWFSGTSANGGYFSLEELASVRHLGILAIARFQAFKPARLSALDLRLG